MGGFSLPMPNKFEQLESIRRFINRTIEENYFPELERVGVASIAEAARQTGLAPNLIYRLLLSEEIEVNGLVATVNKEELPKQRDQVESSIWGEGQRYQRRPMFLPGAHAKLTKSRIEAITNNAEIERAKIILQRKDDETERDETKERLAKRWLFKSERAALSPEEKFFTTIQDLSIFPIQNPEIIRENIERAILEVRPFKIRCFGCLSITSDNIGGIPQIRVVPNGYIRILDPEVKRRTSEIIRELNKTSVNFQIEMILADTDPVEIYQNTSDQEFEIQATLDRIKKEIPKVNVVRWSEIEQTYPTRNNNIVIDENDIYESMQRRIDYYRQKGFTITPEIVTYAEECGRRLIKSYAKQGLTMSKKYDCLAIADPNPQKYGRWQSLLDPDLPICYLYSG